MYRFHRPESGIPTPRCTDSTSLPQVEQTAAESRQPQDRQVLWQEMLLFRRHHRSFPFGVDPILDAVRRPPQSFEVAG